VRLTSRRLQCITAGRPWRGKGVVMRIIATRFHALLSTVLLISAVAPASGQYFGQNKVQYERFDFQVARTDRFDIYFYPEIKEGVEVAARLAERWTTRLERLLDHRLSSRQPLVLYASSAHFQQTTVIPGAIGEGTGGVTEGLRRRVVMPFAGPLWDTDHVLGHELVHAFQYDISTQRTREAGRAGARISGLQTLPLWFVEGMAEYLSIGARSPITTMWVRDAILQEKLPTIEDLGDPRYFPYRWGHALWAYIAGRWGDRAVSDMLASGIITGDPEKSFEIVLGVTEDQLTEQWHAALREAYQPAASQASRPHQHGRLLTPERGLGGDINVSPSLSPDGVKVAFLSERSLLSIDLFVADVASAKVLRQLTTTAVDPHLNSLQFIASAGAWDPSSTRLVITGVVDGRPRLLIYDVNSGDKLREQELDGVDAAFNPAWSPDGRTIAFIGMRQGFTDVFAIDVESGRVDQWTSDPHTQLHPAWSPDGRSLALATSQFTTTLDTLAIGDLRLAVFDVATRRSREIAAFTRGKHINPQWSVDGRSLFFVGDPDGIANVFRVPVDGGTPRQVTSVYTGTSGITETSPVISTAVKVDRLVFTVFEAGDQRLYVSDAPETLRGREVVFGARDDAAFLPPRRERSGPVTELLRDPTVGLPAADAITEVAPYRPRLALDYVGQPSFSVGADRWGAFGGGGLSFFMSDMLGNHNLGVMVQTTTSFDEDFSANDIGGALVYQNQSRRWTWGAAVDQTPYRTGYVVGANAIIDDRPVTVQEAVILRQADRGATGMVAYPFSRAQRIEFTAGLRNLAFSQKSRVTAYALDTGELLLDQENDLGGSESITMGQTSAALVYDTSSFGATSPVFGQRYRFEVSPVLGDIRYTGLLLDYRRYFMPAPFYTLATRVMHYGRYGSGGEDPRLSPLYLGYPTLVRGYDVGSFDQADCPPSPDGSCPAVDRLTGSRIAVANVELRFPLLRPFGASAGMYGPVPVEVALFADGGVAWDANEASSPFYYRSDGKPISSVGAALRVNALGFAVLQFDLSRPLQREGRGWVFQFSMAPGF
jgi:Tol biopolymer transport system component